MKLKKYCKVEEKEKKMKIVSVMPIKLANKRLPGKNTMLLGGKPLLQYELEELTKVDLINERYVFCSDENIKKYLISGIEFLRREKELDLDTSNFTQIFRSFMQKKEADIYVYVHATAPFVTAEIIRECIENVISGKHDSAFCATKIQDFLWKNNKPLNFNGKNLPRSQDIEPIYRETSGVYVFTKEVFDKLNQRIGECPFIKEVGYKEAIDINEAIDFKLAEAMLNIQL